MTEKNYNSAIQSLQMVIKNLEENLNDCKNAVENNILGPYSPSLEETKENIKSIERDIEEHKEAIIALRVVAGGKLRVI